MIIVSHCSGGGAVAGAVAGAGAGPGGAGGAGGACGACVCGGRRRRVESSTRLINSRVEIETLVHGMQTKD